MKYIGTLFTLLLFGGSLNAQIQAGFTINDSIICVNDCVVFSNTSTGDISTYNWTFAGGNPASYVGATPPPICYSTGGSFSVSLTVTGTGPASTYSESISIGTYPDSVVAKLDTTIEMGSAVYLKATGYGNGQNYNWVPTDIFECPSCNETYASPIITQYCTIEFFNASQCKVKDSVLITVKFKDVIAVPNSFSPDGDGINDKLFVKGPGITSMRFQIFDRYGFLVFETTDLEEGWDGTIDGQEVNPATFLWTLDYSLVDNTRNKKSGSISLIK
jgi:gliding motility-associated-like protein